MAGPHRPRSHRARCPRLGTGCSVVDIGCGRGFDEDLALQKSLAALSGRYIGIEPNTDVEPGAHFGEIHRCLFEQAPIKAGSVDVAFAVMVLEHVQNPRLFLNKVHEILKPGGIFWGMTVDGRSLFAKASFWLERLHGKELYMRWLRGRRGEGRYLNYPVFYRCNTPHQIEAQTSPLRNMTLSTSPVSVSTDTHSHIGYTPCPTGSIAGSWTTTRRVPCSCFGS